MLIAKLLVQKLWQLKLGWDEEIPSHILKDWQDRASSSHSSSTAKTLLSSSQANIIVRTYDASQTSYACGIYLRAVYQDSSVSVSDNDQMAKWLIMAMSYIFDVLDMPASQIYAWSDSAITELVADSPILVEDFCGKPPGS